MWLAVQHKLEARFTERGITPDPAVTGDIARMVRVPGSNNTAADCPVEFLIHSGPGQRHERHAVLHTQNEMAAALDVQLQVPVFVPMQAHIRARRSGLSYQDAGKMGWTSGNRRRLRDFESFMRQRGDKVMKGNPSRNHAACVFSFLLRRDAGQAKAVEPFGREICKPPLTASEIRGAIKFGNNTRRMTDFTIGRFLGITEADAVYLEGRKYLEPAPKRRHRIPADVRRRAIREICISVVESLSKIRVALAERNIPASRPTIAADLWFLGLAKAKTHQKLSLK